MNDKVVTGTVSHIIAISSLSGNFNVMANKLVITATHLNIINTDSYGQGGGVR